VHTIVVDIQGSILLHSVLQLRVSSYNYVLSVFCLLGQFNPEWSQN